MAVKVDQKPTKARATGAAAHTASPITTELTADSTSTGAAKYIAPGTIRAEHIDAEVVVTTKPAGPVTTTAPWAQNTAVSAADEKVETK